MGAEDDGTPTHACCGEFEGQPHARWCERLKRGGTLSISRLQDEVNTRWAEQTENPCHTSSDPAHALIHIVKAAGRIASALNDAQHEGRKLTAAEIAKYCADVVICTARFAGDTVSLERACIERLEEKFPKH